MLSSALEYKRCAVTDLAEGLRTSYADCYRANVGDLSPAYTIKCGILSTDSIEKPLNA